MKLNWSKILIIAMSLFIIMIVSMGIRMATSDSELYERDYYQKGEEHAERMDKEQVGLSVDVKYDNENDLLILNSEKSIKLIKVKGIYLADSKNDFILNGSEKETDQMKVRIDLKEGSWVLEISGSIEGEEFFKRLEVNL